MKKKVKILNNHSLKVGQDIYDKTNSRVRVEYIGYLNNIEKKKETLVEKEENVEREERKKKLMIEDDKLREQNAREFLIEEDKKKKRNIGFTRRCNVKPAYKTFLQEVIFQEIFQSNIQKFPNERQWKKIFYRFLDSYEKNYKIQNQLRKIEYDIFEHIKIDVEKKSGQWEGTSYQNKIADERVATAIRSSFKSYEKLSIRRDGQFFIF